MRTSDFDYALPPDLIAQEPVTPRDAARMLVIERASGHLTHACVADLPEWLRPGDALIANDTRVFPARLRGRRADTGGRVEVLLLEPVAGGDREWLAMYRAGSRPVAGRRLIFDGDAIEAVVLEALKGGRVRLALEGPADLTAAIERCGEPPLPPYIKRPAAPPAGFARDRLSYQTVFARERGAVAAPTAGLHFTPELLARIEARGVARACVTLHVGPGTFTPVKTDDPAAHVMESERYRLGPETVQCVAETRARGGRVVAVGSTTVRVLESVAAEQATLTPCEGRTAIFIRPPYTFKVVQALLTNFHLPCSTLLMMVSAFAEHDLIMRAYAEAVRLRYRFYSYGDCMLIL